MVPWFVCWLPNLSKRLNKWCRQEGSCTPSQYSQCKSLQNQGHSVGLGGEVRSGRRETGYGQTVDLQERQAVLNRVPAPCVVHQCLGIRTRTQTQKDKTIKPRDSRTWKSSTLDDKMIICWVRLGVFHPGRSERNQTHPRWDCQAFCAADWVQRGLTTLWKRSL